MAAFEAEPVYASLMLAWIEATYGVRAVRVDPLVEMTDWSVYRVRRRWAPSWIVRVFPWSRSAERVAGDAAVLEWLERRRFPAERLVRTAGGEATGRIAERGVLVTRAISGTPPGLTESELEAFGDLVGYLSTLPPYVTRPAGSTAREDLERGRSLLAAVEPLVPASRRVEFQRLTHGIAATADLEDLPRGFIHPDCQPNNVLRRRNGRLVLLDWEGAGVGPRVQPLGQMLFMVAVSSAARPRLARVDAVLRGFLRRGRLDDTEVARLADAIRVRPLVVAAREFASSIERGEMDARAGLWNWWQVAGEIAERAWTTLGRPRRRALWTRVIDQQRLPDPALAAIEACVGRLLGGAAHSVERAGSGTTTPVYRVLSGGRVVYLRVAEDPSWDLAPEVEAHRTLINRGVRVPEVLAYERRDRDIGRSVALLGEIAGEAVGWAPALAIGPLEEIMRMAGEDLAKANAVPVHGWGWIRREPGFKGLRGEKPSLRDWLYSGDAEDVEGCLDTVRRHVALPRTALLLALIQGFADARIESRLVHGDTCNGTHPAHARRHKAQDAQTVVYSRRGLEPSSA